MPEPEKAARALADRLDGLSRERLRRAAELTAALLARAAPPVAPAPLPAEPEPGLLARLRTIIGDWLYTDIDAEQSTHWLGSDPFHLRALPPPPARLGGIDVRALTPDRVAPVLRRLSLAGPETQPGAESGAVSRNERTGFEIPRVLHAIWFGPALPAGSSFLRNVGHAARRYAGEIDVFLWLDRGGEAVPDHVLAWAEDYGVTLLDIFELFHADAPMLTHAQVVLELAKQRPPGYAAASDLARLEIVYRFGGLYADGDLEYADQDRDPTAAGPRPENLVEFLDRIAGSEPGFTMDPIPRGGITNDIVAAPARHRVIRLWLEETRVNYYRSQAQIFGGLETMALPYAGQERFAERHVTPHRTGRMHHRVLDRLSLGREDLPPAQPPFRFRSAGSWMTYAGRPGDFAQDDVLATLERCLTVLEWQTIAREGDLYLTAVDPLVRALPDPDAAWIALLRVLPRLPGAAAVTSVTDVRRREDRRLECVELPPEAQALIDRRALRDPAVERATNAVPLTAWLGAELRTDGAPVWLFDERVEPAALREYGDAERLRQFFGRLAEVVYDSSSGEPIGLWLRPDEDVRAWRHPLRFAHVRSGWFGVSIGGEPGWDWRENWPLDLETVARLVLAAGAACRPVLLSAPWGCGPQAAAGLAERLSSLLEQPVECVDGPARRPGLLMRASSTAERSVHYLPLAAASVRFG